MGGRERMWLMPSFFISSRSGSCLSNFVLPAVVGEHLPGHAVHGNAPLVCHQYLVGRLSAVQTQGRDVPGVNAHEADQIRIAASKTKGHDAGLPQQVRTGFLEKPGIVRVLDRLGPGTSSSGTLF